jgi:hypothetical protein
MKPAELVMRAAYCFAAELSLGCAHRRVNFFCWSHGAVDRNGKQNFRTNQPVKGAPSARREAVSPLTG